MSLLALMVGTILGWLLKRSERVLLHTHVPTLAALGTLPILLGYSFIAGMNTPVLRALIMTLVLLLPLFSAGSVLCLIYWLRQFGLFFFVIL